MNLCKRAFLYSIRKIGKTLTLLAFLLVMGNADADLLFHPVCHRKRLMPTSKRLFWDTSQSMENSWRAESQRRYGSRSWGLTGLSGRYTLRSYSYAEYCDAQGNPLEINTEEAAQIPEGYEHAGKIVANSNSQDDSYFTEGGFELTQGEPITTEGGNQVLIHEKFAQRNGLSVGDTMLLKDVEGKNRTIPVTVAGIFTNTKEQDSIGIAPSYDLYDNIVFTDLSTAASLLYETEDGASVQYGDFLCG